MGSRSVVFSALHVAYEKKIHSFGFPRSRNFREIALAHWTDLQDEQTKPRCGCLRAYSRLVYKVVVISSEMKWTAPSFDIYNL